MDRKSIDGNYRRKPSGAAVIRPELTAALFRALFEEWARTGYAAISLQRVAARAGAGKAAIYRRWPSKRDFASDAIETVGLHLSDFPDHGSLEADIIAFLVATRRTLRHRLACRILPDLFAERMRSGDLAPVLERLSAARRRRGAELLDRAVARGELRADLDRELALDLIPSALYWRLVILGKPVGKAALHRQAAAILAALRAC
ncbi:MULTISPECIES: TetR-like C-terminal domain-containing protein [unclassified Chelatococcus]|uniref:TetR-like C-terminal domain-containing protein n=1 Tax=unclassified Chelatococcus TaxID=2638111 RepID=UPI001BCFD0BD|nr:MULTISPECIES: TetR-like C-terminal domain-containing protein [unclassified Chelatococcus]CAH1672844.1 Transcriptional regulator, TetR family [Hyphomicrobiales bacterium]MBS7738899.1 TetR/AcrR family transcriptional regulator C-terminal ligand-binding domain-containing protein [Chelatococcus sp. HY11]MBX3547051.1 TetR/AcrR family transcriptional regulator C-terminal ligand-binding domain-containing protein [Chelatococcus sp.]MCO5076572.1 TetR/AcrR family transcriptional regulator C-terminal l